jgi:Fic family protein
MNKTNIIIYNTADGKASVSLLAKATVSSLIEGFEEKGILKEITGYERNKLFAFEKYLNIYSQS